MITPDREQELAVEISARRANDALERTPDGVVYRLIEGLDDFAPLPDAEVRKAAQRIADLIRTGRATVVFPQLYLGTGDGEPVAPIPKGLAGSPGPITINNPEGWEDSWDRERAADEQRALEDGADAEQSSEGRPC